MSDFPDFADFVRISDFVDLARISDEGWWLDPLTRGCGFLLGLGIFLSPGCGFMLAEKGVQNF